MVFYEWVCGVCLYVVYFWFGGVYQDLLFDLLDDIEEWCEQFLKLVDDLIMLLIENCIVKQCFVDIGIVLFEDCFEWGYIGVMVCGLGMVWDLCCVQFYECYDEFDFQILVGKNGDCYDCYLIWMQEMCELIKIMKQVVQKLWVEFVGDVLVCGKLMLFWCFDMKCDMESLIYYFKLYIEGFKVLVGEVYVVVEVFKGEFGVYLVLDGMNKLWWVKLCVLGFVYL